MMRSIRPMALVAIWAGVDACSAPHPPVSARPPVSCQVAESIIQVWASRTKAGEQNVLDHGPDSFPGEDKLDVQTFVSRINWRRSPPPTALAAKFLRTKGADALTACPELAALAGRLHWGVGDAAADALTNGVDQSGNPRLVWNGRVSVLSLPVVDDQGDAALAATGSSCGPLCGAGWVHYLRRAPNGQWVIVDSYLSWIS